MGRHYDISELEASIFSDEILEEPDIVNTEEVMLSEEMPEPLTEELEIDLADGKQMVCEIVDVFVHEEGEYMVLHPKEDTEGIVYLMRMSAGENDELRLSPIDDEEEFRTVSDVFQEIYKTENIEENEEKEDMEGNEDHDRD